jgi:outer membrane protein, heavy metal efflux system
MLGRWAPTIEQAAYRLLYLMLPRRGGALVRVAITGSLLAFTPLNTTAADLRDEPPLGELSFRAAERLLLQRNREIRAARRAVDSAKAGVLIAGARPNPNLTLQTSNINPQDGIGPGGLRDKAFDTQIRVDYVIERGQKRDLRLATATAQATATDEDLNDVLRIQPAVLANAYYNLLLAQERVRITRETAGLFRATLAASQRRLTAGDIAATDVNRISVDELRAQSDEQSAIADRNHAQFALASVLGLEAHAQELIASDAWPGSIQEPNLEDVDALLDRRPDVRAAKAHADAAWPARELAHSQRIRDVTIGVTYDHWPTNATNMQGTGNSYGFAVSVPLFLGNHFDGDIAKAEADWGAALDFVERTIAGARVDLARTRSDLDVARERVTRFDRELLVAAKRVADAQEFAYQRGAIGVLDLLDARRTLRSVQLDAASARADYAKALAAWRQARPSPSRD